MLPQACGARRCRTRQLSVCGVALLLASVLLTRVAAAVPADDMAALTDLFARGQQKNGTLTSLRARFTETTTSPLLTKPLVATGELVALAPARVAIRYDAPDARMVLIDKDNVTLVAPTRSTRQVFPLGAGQRRLQVLLFAPTPAELGKVFDISVPAEHDRPGTMRVQLVPKRKQMREGLSQLTLWVNNASLLVDGVRLSYPGGEVKDMSFAQVVLNSPVDPAWFQLPQ